MEYNFKPQNTDSRGFKYDYYSIMHYGRDYYSKNGGDTIVPKDPRYLNIIGKAKHVRFIHF